MKIAMLILGIIGAIAGFGGSIMTVIGGFAGTAAGVMTEENKTAMTGAMVFWAGVYTVIISALALISSIVGGVGKAKTTIQTFAIANIVLGAVSVYLFNFVSGGLILIAGILGIIGAKGADQQEKSILKSGLFYFVAIVLGAAVLVSIAIRNANNLRKDGAEVAKASEKKIEPAQAPPSKESNGDVIIAKLVDSNQGDTGCGLKLAKPNGEEFEAFGTFELCEDKYVKGQTYRFKYEIIDTMATECQGAPDCKKTEKTRAIVSGEREK